MKQIFQKFKQFRPKFKFNFKLRGEFGKYKKNLKGFDLAHPVTAVEVGDEWIKVVENSPASKGDLVTKLCFVNMAQIKKPPQEVLEDLFRDHKFFKKSAVLYIPRNLVTVRALELPSTNKEEIKDMVNLQVGRQTPYSREEIISSYQVISRKKEGYTKVLLVIVRRKLVDDRIEMMRGLGVYIDKVSVSSECVNEWFKITYSLDKKNLEELSSGKVVVLIDMDYGYSDIIFVCREIVIFTINILVGAKHLLYERNEWEDKFIQEVGHSIELYSGEAGDADIEKVILTGAAGNIEGLDALLKQRLNMPVEKVYFLKNVRIKNEIAAFEAQDYKNISLSAILGAVIGHRNLEIDLTPFELRVARLMEYKRRQLTLMGILFIAVGMAVFFLFFIRVYYKSDYLNKLTARIAQIEAPAKEVELMRNQIDVVERKLDIRGSSIDVLYEMTSIVPKEIYLININIDDKKQVVLRGRAAAMVDVFNFVTTLENSPIFHNVKLTYTSIKKEGDAQYAEFKMALDINGGL